MTDWLKIREEFPALRNWTFLNTATFGQLPKRAHAAIQRHLDRRDQFACTDFLKWFDDLDVIRGTIGRLINCQGEDIAYFQNASHAISLLARGIDWQPGDHVVTLDDEFPNHLYWGAALEKRGVIFDVVSWEDLPAVLTSRTRLVMASTVNYVTGLRLPIPELVRLCREAGAISYVDGTQSLGALRFDCAAIQPDVFAVDGYKWLLSPNGAGFAYFSNEIRQWLTPDILGWRSDKSWREVNSLNHGAPEFKHDAERYEAGMVPFAPIYGMAASVELMLEIGPEAIERRVLALADYARNRLREMGATLMSEDSAIICARFPGVDPGELSRALQAQRILTAARHGNLRISTHFYNTEADVDVLVEALQSQAQPIAR